MADPMPTPDLFARQGTIGQVIEAVGIETIVYADLTVGAAGLSPARALWVYHPGPSPLMLYLSPEVAVPCPAGLTPVPPGFGPFYVVGLLYAAEAGSVEARLVYK